MSITASDVIDRAKVIWGAASASIISDANALLFLSDGVLELRAIRPETQFVSGVYTAHTEVSGTGSTINIDVKFRPCLVDYLVWRGFQADSDSQRRNDRAELHKKQFYERAKTI
jgi:hypothetical protein